MACWPRVPYHHITVSSAVSHQYLRLGLDLLGLDTSLPFESHYVVFLDAADPLHSFTSLSVMRWSRVRAVLCCVAIGVVPLVLSILLLGGGVSLWKRRCRAQH